MVPPVAASTEITAPLIVVMGVSGSGKSTVGAALATTLGVSFIDGDDLHPAANVSTMAAGQPLTDGDRWPWLESVGRALAAASTTGLVVACSALRRVYRDAIAREAPDVRFVLLDGSREVLAARLGARTEHFMPASLLDSQLATLETLESDERGVTLDIELPIDEITRIAAGPLGPR
jgi:gluconokinase